MLFRSDPAHRGFDVRGNLHQIEARLPRDLQRFSGGHDAQVLAVGPDQAHFADPYVFVDA